MKKLHLVGIALLAVFAFSAFAVTSAFAEGQLLLGGKTIAAGQEQALEVSGELELEDMNATGPPKLLCSGIFDGHTVGPALFLITELLMLNKEALLANGTAGTPGVHIECEEHNGICSSPVLVIADHLPWNIVLELMTVEGSSVYLALFLSSGAGEPGYIVDCNSILGLVEDACTTEAGSARLNNTAEGLLGYFNSLAVLLEGFGANSTPANCTVGGKEQGLVTSPSELVTTGGLITSNNGEALTVSE